MPYENRVKLLNLSGYEFMALLRALATGSHRITIPDDLTFVTFKHDPLRDHMLVKVWSNTFPILPHDCPAEYWCLELVPNVVALHMPDNGRGTLQFETGEMVEFSDVVKATQRESLLEWLVQNQAQMKANWEEAFTNHTIHPTVQDPQSLENALDFIQCTCPIGNFTPDGKGCVCGAMERERKRKER